MYQYLHKILLLTFLSSALIIQLLSAQEAKPELVYGCGNCVITSFLPMGENKVLIYATNNKPTKRKMYLLDDSNLIVDEMKIDAAQSFVKVNDSIFSPLDVNYSVMIKIEANELKVAEAYEFHHGITHGINTPNTFMNPEYIIGFDYIKNELDTGVQLYLIDRPEKKFINSKRFHMSYDLKEFPPFDYGSLTKDDTTVIFQPYGKLIGKSDDTFSRYFGYKDGMTYIWAATHKTFIRLDKDGNMRRSKLPIENENTEMKMYYDNVSGEAYFLTWESGMEEENAVYKLYRLTEEDKLQSLYKLSFFPMIIDDGYAYEGRAAKKSFEVYKYPLKGQVSEKVVPFGFDEN
ncbi:hypothetical protein [Algoriphagus winogradskyi]|uniref:DUF4221 domain-containing protein n=1 Tax=Algoriphagus winogradskyi TaxID=237017 RepID=A0ABY1PE86_9BACT|nr:hypothetical protein [Algoriphagus winogradskyi]SMP30199.1 hypothetical protein SAMN06265367_106286 [Algoriphagus winogradskyi]